jgi:hypothetical protein
MHYSQPAADRIAAARHSIAIHLAAPSGDRCAACDQPFPCAFRQAAEGILDAYGCLPRRRPGAALRAAGFPLGALDEWPINPPVARRRNDKAWRGWFESRINPAVGRVSVRSMPRTVRPTYDTF